MEFDGKFPTHANENMSALFWTTNSWWPKLRFATRQRNQNSSSPNT